MSLRNQRGVVGVFPAKHQDKMSHPGKCPVEEGGCGELLLVQGMAWGLGESGWC